MSETQTLGPWLERYLLEYIVTERNLARNTQKSYRDTFKMLVLNRPGFAGGCLV